MLSFKTMFVHLNFYHGSFHFNICFRLNFFLSIHIEFSIWSFYLEISWKCIILTIH